MTSTYHRLQEFDNTQFKWSKETTTRNEKELIELEKIYKLLILQYQKDLLKRK